MTPNFSMLVLILILSLNLQAQITSGLWSTGCNKGLKKEQIYGSNHKVISTENFYSDAHCTHESFRFQTIGLVKYDPNSPTFIDFTYEDIYLSVFNNKVIEDFNLRKVCGYSTWKVAQAQNITGLKCAIFNINHATPIPAAGDSKYGIFQKEQNKLYYGQLSQELDGSTPAKRPFQINLLTEYIFQN